MLLAPHQMWCGPPNARRSLAACRCLTELRAWNPVVGFNSMPVVVGHTQECKTLTRNGTCQGFTPHNIWVGLIRSGRLAYGGGGIGFDHASANSWARPREGAKQGPRVFPLIDCLNVRAFFKRSSRLAHREGGSGFDYSGNTGRIGPRMRAQTLEYTPTEGGNG